MATVTSTSAHIYVIATRSSTTHMRQKCYQPHICHGTRMTTTTPTYLTAGSVCRVRQHHLSSQGLLVATTTVDVQNSQQEDFQHLGEQGETILHT